jgi:hypothetical protein
MKLILPLSSLTHCHITKSAHTAAYLMSMKPPLRLALEDDYFFPSNTRASYHCIKTKKKLVLGYNPTKIDGRWTQASKPAEHNPKHMKYSYPTQPKRLALSVALSRRSIPQGERSWFVLQHQK